MTIGIAELRRHAAELLGLEPGEIDPDDPLPDLGMDSVQMMEIETLMREAGADVDVADLLAEPTLRAWAELLRDAG